MTSSFYLFWAEMPQRPARATNRVSDGLSMAPGGAEGQRRKALRLKGSGRILMKSKRSILDIKLCDIVYDIILYITYVLYIVCYI